MERKFHFASRRRYRPLVFLAILYFAPVVYANDVGEYVLVKPGTWTGDLLFPNVIDTCQAYENNLAHFKNEPAAMACERKLYPNLGFTRPEWLPLDVATHRPLLKSFFKYRNWKPIDDKGIDDLLSKKRLTLELARVDLDGDGALDNLVRYGSGRECEAEQRMRNFSAGDYKLLFQANSDLTSVLSKHITGVDNVFLYEGHVYTDVVRVGSEGIPTRTPNNSRPVATLVLRMFSKYSDSPICHFTYFKKQTDK